MNDWFSHPEFLAPGDAKSVDFHSDNVTVTSIDSVTHPFFDKAFEALWKEFGSKAEIEGKEILEKRLQWLGKKQTNGYHFQYQLLWIEKEGVPMGVRDHTAIYHPLHQRLTVHLSHNLIFPDFRRSGFAGWMRAWPLIFAKCCMEMWKINLPVTLVAEMEPFRPEYPDRLPRLISAERAGFLKVSDIDYLQPDFRSPAEIDRGGESKALPMSLILRRVNQESRRFISGRELSELVDDLYQMYGAGFRPHEMEKPWSYWGEIDLYREYALDFPTH
ncbi:MAG: hypothetical protein V4507_00785 [Verrucomicrobiota bacterium]